MESKPVRTKDALCDNGLPAICTTTTTDTGSFTSCLCPIVGNTTCEARVIYPPNNPGGAQIAPMNEACSVGAELALAVILARLLGAP